MVFNFNNKKAISSVISITLLILISILAFAYINSWFYSVESNLNADLEKKELSNNFEIIKIDSSYIYLNNKYSDNLSVNSILLDGTECLSFDTQIDEGLVRVDVAKCTVGLNDLVAREITIVLDDGVINSVKLLENSVTSDLIVLFTNDVCDISLGYKRLYGLTDLDNAHAETDGSSTYHVCVRHINFDLIVNSGTGQDIFYLDGVNNSAVWINTSSAYQEPALWNNISIEAVGASTYSFIVSSSIPGENYACLGIVDRDDVYGSHIGDCDSAMDDKIWLKIE